MKYAGLITHIVYIHINMVFKRRGSLSVEIVNCTFLFFTRSSICQSRDTLPKHVYINGALAYLQKTNFSKLVRIYDSSLACLIILYTYFCVCITIAFVSLIRIYIKNRKQVPLAIAY